MQNAVGDSRAAKSRLVVGLLACEHRHGRALCPVRLDATRGIDQRPKASHVEPGVGAAQNLCKVPQVSMRKDLLPDTCWSITLWSIAASLRLMSTETIQQF